MDSFILANWTSPFPILGVPCVLFYSYFVLIEILVSKHWMLGIIVFRQVGYIYHIEHPLANLKPTPKILNLSLEGGLNRIPTI